MRRGYWLALLLLVLVLVALRLFDRQTLLLLQATRDLGPISGWRCSASPFYVYDPTREAADSTLEADPQESLVQERAPDETIDHVETDLRRGESLVWTYTLNADDEVDARRVYVLSPGRLQPVTAEMGGSQVVICNAHLGDWRIVGEHTL